MRKNIMLVVAALSAGAACASNVVTYEEFGAVGDGKTDDQKAIVAAHAAANKRRLPVRAGDGRTYYIGGGAKVAVIKTDVDFGTAKFVIDDRNLENVKAPVFRVDPSARSFEVKGVKTLTIKGGTFTTIANQAESTYNYHARGIAVRRSNVRIEGLRHDVTGEGDHGAQPFVLQPAQRLWQHLEGRLHRAQLHVRAERREKGRQRARPRRQHGSARLRLRMPCAATDRVRRPQDR